MTTDERIDRLTIVVETLAASVVSHDDQISAHTKQIDGLIKLASESKRRWESLEKQWQAYLNTLPRT